jgi:hypothetical protein
MIVQRNLIKEAKKLEAQNIWLNDILDKMKKRMEIN